jgi:5-formyltetrahydrofolate cyclo-ligase
VIQSPSDQIVRHKYFLRLHYREAVRGMSVAQRKAGARAVAESVARLPEFRRARVLGLFLSLPFEIDTAPLVALAQRAGKTVAVPVVFPETGRMTFAALHEGKPRLKKNVYGILEPVHPAWVEEMDLVVVPGAAFTSRGDRLGAGAGYYDRFLAKHPRLKTVGVCFNVQRAVRLPWAEHDRRVDVVVTPSECFRARNV